MERSEQDRVMNAEVVVMMVAVPDGNVKREKGLKARALPMRKALAWCARAEELERDLGAAKVKGEEAIGEALDAILDHVLGYSAGWPAAHVDAAKEQASAEQVMGALYVLKDLNDPLAMAEARQAVQIERGMKMLDRIAAVNPGAVQKLVSKHLDGASAESEKSSE